MTNSHYNLSITIFFSKTPKTFRPLYQAHSLKIPTLPARLNCIYLFFFSCEGRRKCCELIAKMASADSVFFPMCQTKSSLSSCIFEVFSGTLRSSSLFTKESPPPPLLPPSHSFPSLLRGERASAIRVQSPCCARRVCTYSKYYTCVPSCILYSSHIPVYAASSPGRCSGSPGRGLVSSKR